MVERKKGITPSTKRFMNYDMKRMKERKKEFHKIYGNVQYATLIDA